MSVFRVETALPVTIEDRGLDRRRRHSASGVTMGAGSRRRGAGSVVTRDVPAGCQGWQATRHGCCQSKVERKARGSLRRFPASVDAVHHLHAGVFPWS